MTKITEEELTDILGLTVKEDQENKLITFYSMLLTYTEKDQVTLSFRAPSSTGKSYIPLELAQLFPKEDVIELAYASPTAFFHEWGNFDKEKGTIRIDLQRKIIVFVDQPHDQLLQRIRPLLSHDKKELTFKITDRSKKAGYRTKSVVLVGYPSVVFCTGSLRIDEQEATRMFMLSPETSQEKLRQALILKEQQINRPTEYKTWLESDPMRMELKGIIELIKAERIRHIIIPNGLLESFAEKEKNLKPRHLRDVERLSCLIKGHALLNLWDREKVNVNDCEESETDIIANKEDVEIGLRLWKKIERTQDLGIPPYLYQLYDEVIVPAFKDKGLDELGTSIKNIIKKHHEVYGRPLNQKTLVTQIIPTLEGSGLISKEPDPNDKRTTIIIVNE